METSISTLSVKQQGRKWQWWHTAGTAVVTIALLVLLFPYLTPEATQVKVHDFLGTVFTTEILFYIAAGLCAQLVDGALGMAYGATSSSLLLGMGVSPAVSSASVHVAEVFTTGASGFSHFKLGNVNKKLFLCLLIPGMTGAITGAYLLADRINGDLIKPYISIYLLVLGVIVIRKAFRRHQRKARTKRLAPLAFAGGFMDAVGGGGWGPIVTATLLSKGRAVHYTIGSVNAAEFFISLSSAITFLFFTGISSWQGIIGLVTGGVIASPFAALLVRKIKRKPLMILVGTLIILLSLRTLIGLLG
ncbi:sulfite exporter TauE/SafE family protein [Chitinophaga oryzae]|uniref:Probable membrane transporter protein n=1 Tax=Chitinophaga oryzae TaxID=2725414 RepID=A0AAE6ZKJ7_9BACT|nr:sulfite exporter TauE/SafE family protein [Chitinophaga oryzae]QJB34944.1 sulfite exporter TauE/SafE family protein [Chitinophaga oryzae]